jgi:hypothetical protein
MSEIIPDPNVPVVVLGQELLAWRLNDAPEKRFLAFANDDLKLHPKHAEEILVLPIRHTQTVINLVKPGKVKNAIYHVDLSHIEHRGKLEDQYIRDWLYNLGISFQQKVIVLDRNVVLTTWKMVMKYFDSWVWAHDILVFDENQNWYVYFFHEDAIFYGDHHIQTGISWDWSD